MRRMRWAALAGIGLAAAFALAGCGAGTTTPAAAAPTTPSASAGAAPTTVGTATATVAGKSTTILTNSAGLTLYYFTADSATAAACTGTCAATWPPLLAGGGTPTAAGTLPGTLGILADANGSQVTYNGHPLYIYSGDRAPGDTHGEGIEGKWFVATPSLAVLSASTAKPTGTPCYGYYCP